jgi:hypothetical protein
MSNAPFEVSREQLEEALVEARRLIEPTPLSSVISDQSCVCIRVEVLRRLIQVAGAR